MATSGRDRRRFGPARSLHHLIDPDTGGPADEGPLAVTVTGPDPAQTEAHATALAISSLEAAKAHLDGFPRLSALYVPAAGRPVSIGSLVYVDAPVTTALAHAPIAWYVARAAGLVAFGLLTLSVWLGLAMSTRLATRLQKPLFGWHQTLAWTGLSMLGLHAGALLVDPTIHFGLPSVLVPLASAWKPGAVAAGIVAGWLTAMLAVSFRLRRWIGQKGWRRLHYASFAAFLLALGHALTRRDRPEGHERLRSWQPWPPGRSSG